MPLKRRKTIKESKMIVDIEVQKALSISIKTQKLLKELYRLTKTMWFFKQELKGMIIGQLHDHDNLIEFIIGDEESPYPKSVSNSRMLKKMNSRCPEFKW